MLEASIEVVVPVTYSLLWLSIVIPLAMSVPFPDRYDEYNSWPKSDLILVTNTCVPTLSAFTWYAFVVVGKFAEVVVPAT